MGKVEQRTRAATEYLAGHVGLGPFAIEDSGNIWAACIFTFEHEGRVYDVEVAAQDIKEDEDA